MVHAWFYSRSYFRFSFQGAVVLVIRFISICFSFLLPFISLAEQSGFVRFFDGDGLVIWVGRFVADAQQDLMLDYRAQNMYWSSVLKKMLYRQDLYIDIGTRSPDDVGAILRSYFDPDDSFAYGPIDWGGDFTQPMTPLKPVGTVLYHDSSPVAIVASDGQGIKAVPLVSDGSGGYSAPAVVDGKNGSYTISYSPDVGWSVGFNPFWSGGISDSGTSSSLSIGSSSSSVVPVGGGSGGSTSFGFTVFDVPTSRPVLNDNGDTYYIIDAPATTATLPSGDQIVMRDYTSLLNALGLNLSSGFSKLHDDLDVVNENLRMQLEIDSAVDVAEHVEPSVDTDSVSSEVQEQLDLINSQGSGWGFDFGLGRNSVGDLITSFFGNPPTSFGSQDRVCQIDFDLPLVGSVQYAFVLSDWFHPAFRSCMLMILTIVFAIASAKAVSGAFR